jgi:hypothetical protein
MAEKWRLRCHREVDENEMEQATSIPLCGIIFLPSIFLSSKNF